MPLTLLRSFCFITSFVHSFSEWVNESKKEPPHSFCLHKRADKMVGSERRKKRRCWGHQKDITFNQARGNFHKSSFFITLFSPLPTREPLFSRAAIEILWMKINNPLAWSFRNNFCLPNWTTKTKWKEKGEVKKKETLFYHFPLPKRHSLERSSKLIKGILIKLTERGLHLPWYYQLFCWWILPTPSASIATF